MSTPITLEHLTIEQGISPWGGPLIRITILEKLIETTWDEGRERTFELKHTKGLEGMSGRDKGHGWHVDDVTDGFGHMNWHGVLRMRDAADTDAAIAEMVSYFNHLASRDRVNQAMESPLSEVRGALSGFETSLEFRSSRDHNEEWPRFLAAVAAADAEFRAAGGGQS